MPDKGVTDPLFGNYRAKVVDNVDPEKFGRVKVWIPDLMPLIPPDEGLWARPGNNPLGGRNMEEPPTQWYQGSSYVPRVGTWLWIFFEAGNINRPYYWAALDIENTMVLPENQLGPEYYHKWTIFKSHEGRAIVVADDPYDERVEITGKKRQLSNPPSGDTGSVYTIDGNMTTILLDERAGLEKVLIRTVKGDFLHVDIDEQMLQIYFKNDILIRSDANIRIRAKDDIDILSDTGNIKIQAKIGKISLTALRDISHTTVSSITELALTGKVKSTAVVNNIENFSGKDIKDFSFKDRHIYTLKNYKLTVFEETHIYSVWDIYMTSTERSINILAAMDVNIDAGGIVHEQCKLALPALPGKVCLPALPGPLAVPAVPIGFRDT